jgi:hypothetical protein
VTPGDTGRADFTVFSAARHLQSRNTMPNPRLAWAVLAGLILTSGSGVAHAEPLHLGLRVATMYPLGDAGAESDFASGADLVYWHRAGHFALEPRLGFRVDPDMWKDGGFTWWGADVAAHVVHEVGGGLLLTGAGVGARYLTEQRYQIVRTGQVVMVEHPLLHEDGAFAPTGFLRLAFLSRPSEGGARFSAALDLEVDAAILNGAAWPSSIQFSLGAVY